MEPKSRFHAIIKSVSSNYYNDLGLIDISDDSTLEIIKIKVIPYDGFHKDIEYIITLKFQELDNFPFIYIDSEIYDKIKTTKYLKNKGYREGQHKGICIKNFCYGYNFTKNFKKFCNNEWKNYIYYLITMFNNIQDFEKGNGIKSNYKLLINTI